MLPSAHPSGVPGLPENPRPKVSTPRDPFDLRQLRHSQAPGRPRVAGPTPTLPYPSDAYQRFLAQPGRALVRPNHPRSHPSRDFPHSHRTRTSYPPLHEHLEPKPKALHLDQNRSTHPSKHPPRKSDFSYRTLAQQPTYDDIQPERVLQILIWSMA